MPKDQSPEAIDPNRLPENVKASIRDLSSAVATVSGGLTGGSLIDAQIAGVVGQNAVENNQFDLIQLISPAHAEIGAIHQAHKAGVAKGADMSMTVTGKAVCGYCRGDIAAVAEKAGVKSLTIYEQKTGKTLYWKTGMRTLRERE
ncbi:cytidine deaminase-like fold-containing protein [Snodgrassella alvi]|uniref:cytidine deaminase-like fold-containing protein n=2 Tax=Neisseriaceae TaxID=481 RepID=UPI000C1DE25C|nr:VENN motif pre-toxin domain-containing protein [Snodgrassella alvi]